MALTEEKPMIIFCGTRFNAADMAKELNAFFNKKVAQEYADELLYAETEAQVFQNEQKQKFQKAVAKIYNLPYACCRPFNRGNVSFCRT